MTGPDGGPWSRPPPSVPWRRLLPVLLGAVLLAGGLLPGSITRAQSDAHRAGLVVQFGDGSLQSFCVSFAEESISGLELLDSAGLNTIYDAASTGFGAGVCKIDNDGCNFPIQDCFCQCQGLECVYWSYWHLNAANAWTYSDLGASGYTLQPGQVDGWRWGAGTSGSSEPPPVRAFSEVCLPATATATTTPTASPTATRTSTLQPAPTASPTAVPLQITFAAAPTTLTAGQCATVSWQVTGPWTAIYFQGAIVTPVEQQTVCPAQTETLTLRVDHEGTVDSRTLTLSVAGTAAPTATATPALPASTNTPPAALSPTVTISLTGSVPPAGEPTATREVPTATVTSGAATATPAALPATSTPSPSAALTVVTPTAVALAAAPSTDRVNPAQTAGGRATAAEANSTPWLEYALFGLILAAVGGLAIYILGRQSRGWDDE